MHNLLVCMFLSVKELTTYHRQRVTLHGVIIYIHYNMATMNRAWMPSVRP